MKYCPNCGKKQPEVHEFCTSCGSVIPSDEGFKTGEENENTASKTNKKGFYSVILITLLLIGVGAYVFRDSISDLLSDKESLAGTYHYEENEYGAHEGILIIDEDYYVQIIMKDFYDDETYTDTINFYLKEEDENLYVVDFAEGFIIETKFEAEPEIIAKVIEEEMDEATLEEEGATLINNGDHIILRSELLTNEELYDKGVFHSESFNLEKVGENLRIVDTDIIFEKQ